MKLRAILAVSVLAFASCSVEQEEIKVHVIPEPLQMKVRNSYVDLSEAEMRPKMFKKLERDLSGTQTRSIFL